ncbi:WhiB family transcriptional regulator [Nocardia sp. NBC_01388]|uniref:WhiB family transcriptional regulator n=1 Tax=Nocardia sp. NBC_01388 TaxID=2903596 RepID=UPI003244BE54
MSDWRRQAACRGHEDPEMWCHNYNEEAAKAEEDAIYICLARCEVRLACGEWALITGESDIIAGGYRTWIDADIKELEKELPHVTAKRVRRARRTYECDTCGATFTTTTTRYSEQCRACLQGLVPAEPVREWIRTLLGAGMKTYQIAEAAGRKSNTISGIMAKTDPPQWVRATTAACVFAVGLPEAMSA